VSSMRVGPFVLSFAMFVSCSTVCRRRHSNQIIARQVS